MLVSRFLQTCDHFTRSNRPGHISCVSNAWQLWCRYDLPLIIFRSILISQPHVWHQMNMQDTKSLDEWLLWLVYTGGKVKSKLLHHIQSELIITYFSAGFILKVLLGVAYLLSTPWTWSPARARITREGWCEAQGRWPRPLYLTSWEWRHDEYGWISLVRSKFWQECHEIFMQRLNFLLSRHWLQHMYSDLCRRTRAWYRGCEIFKPRWDHFWCEVSPARGITVALKIKPRWPFVTDWT